MLSEEFGSFPAFAGYYDAWKRRNGSFKGNTENIRDSCDHADCAGRRKVRASGISRRRM